MDTEPQEKTIEVGFHGARRHFELAGNL